MTGKQFIKISEFRRWLEEHDQEKELVFCDYYGAQLTVNEYQVGVQVGDNGEAQEYAVRVVLDVDERQQIQLCPCGQDVRDCGGCMLVGSKEADE